MPIVNLSNGTRLSFPDGMSAEEMTAAIKANFPEEFGGGYKVPEPKGFFSQLLDDVGDGMNRVRDEMTGMPRTTSVLDNPAAVQRAREASPMPAGLDVDPEANKWARDRSKSPESVMYNRANFDAQREKALAEYDRGAANRKAVADANRKKLKDAAEAEDYGVTDFAKDSAKSWTKGLIGLGQAGIGLGNMATGGLSGEFVRDFLGVDLEGTKTAISKSMSATARSQAADVQEAQGFYNTLKELSVNPLELTNSLTESLPGTLAAGGAGGYLSRKIAVRAAAEAQALNLTGLAASDFIRNKVEAQIGKIAFAASAAEGAQSAGQIAEMAQAQGRDWEDYVLPALTAGLGTTAIGIMSNKVGRRLGIGDIETDIAMRTGGVGANLTKGQAVAAIGKEMLKEGALEELPQSVQEQINQNLALGKPWYEGIGAAGAQGLLAGMAMGGGHSAAGKLAKDPYSSSPYGELARELDNNIAQFNIGGAAEEARARLDVQNYDPRILRPELQQRPVAPRVEDMPTTPQAPVVPRAPAAAAASGDPLAPIDGASLLAGVPVEGEADPQVQQPAQSAAVADEGAGYAQPTQAAAPLPQATPMGKQPAVRFDQSVAPKAPQQQAPAANAATTARTPDVIPQPTQANDLIRSAITTARSHADLADEAMYTPEVLQNIISHPQADATLRKAAKHELDRRAQRGQAGKAPAMELRDNPAPRPLSVERGLELANTSRTRALLPQEQAYLQMLKREIGDQAFDLVMRSGAQPFRVNATERKFDLPRLVEQNRASLAEWDQANNPKANTKPRITPAAQPQGKKAGQSYHAWLPVEHKGQGYGNLATASTGLDQRAQPSSGGAVAADQRGTSVPVSQTVNGQSGVPGGAFALRGNETTGAATPRSQPLKLAKTAPINALNWFKKVFDKEFGTDVNPYTGPLSPRQQAASAIAALQGKTLTFLSDKTGNNRSFANGVAMGLGGKHIAINADSTDDSPVLVALHEIFHTLPVDLRSRFASALVRQMNEEGTYDAGVADFLQKFDYEAKDVGEELPAFVVQLIGKRQSFWEGLRDKLGDGDFKSVVQHLLKGLRAYVFGVKDAYGDAFAKKYLGDLSKLEGILQDILIENNWEAEGSGQIATQTQAEPEAVFALKSADFTNPEDRTTVSTAQPWAKEDRKTGYQPNSYAEKRVIDGADIRASKTHVAKIAEALRKYNTLSGSGNAAKLMQELHDLVVDNLLWLHDHVKPEARARAKLWYDGANRIANDWTKSFNINLRQASGILAVFSPQMDWFKNVSLAERTLVILRDHANERWSDGMTKWAESWLNSSKTVDTKVSRHALVTKMRAVAEGKKTLSELEPQDAALFIRAFDEAYFPRSYRLITPEGGFGDFVENGSAVEYDAESEDGADDAEREDGADAASVTWGGFGTIEKAVKIYRDGSFRTVDLELGGEHKVRNFYNNIADPQSADGHVTIDTHAVAAALVKALSGNSDEVKHNLGGLGSTAATGASGSYALFADAYRDAAAQRGILAREMQSITWEAVRSLFPASLKSGMADKVSAVWDLVKSGEISRGQAREQVLKLSREAGGDKPFAWENSGSGAFASDGATSFDAVVAEDPSEREVRTLPPSEAKDKIKVSLSAATNSIPGVKALYDAAQKGDLAAHALLQDIALDNLRHLLAGTSASIKAEPATGLYGGASEPSMSLTVSFTDTDRGIVLAALAQFADNFNQEQVHVRQGTKEKVGTKFPDGSYATPVYRWELRQALDRKAIQKIIDKSGLYGLTFGDGFVEAYYVGDTHDTEAFGNFERSIGIASTLVGRAAKSAGRSVARLWPYGHGDGAIGYGNIRGQYSSGAATSSKTAKRVAEYLRGAKVKAFNQAPEITEKQAALQREIAQVYESLPDNDLKNSMVRKAYAALAKEAVRQYKALPIKVEVMTGNGEPYSSSEAMRRDLLDNNHLFVFGTTPETFGPAGEDFSKHPLLADAGVTDINGYPMLANDVLRAVHDYYAHAMSVTQFGPKGEEAAWKNHMSMTADPLARWALTSETRGQNSWVNFNAAVDQRTPVKDRPFARQKAVLLPVKYALTGHAQTDAPMKEFIKGLSDKDQAGSKPMFSRKAQDTRDLDQDITLEIPVEGGGTAKLTVNAKTYLEQLDRRQEALEMVKECML